MRPLRPEPSPTNLSGIQKKPMGHLYPIDFTTVSHWDTIANPTLQEGIIIPQIGVLTMNTNSSLATELNRTIVPLIATRPMIGTNPFFSLLPFT